MAVRKQIVRTATGEERINTGNQEYSVEEIFDHLNSASKRMSKKMEIIAHQEQRSWAHARVRNSGLK